MLPVKPRSSSRRYPSLIQSSFDRLVYELLVLESIANEIDGDDRRKGVERVGRNRIKKEGDVLGEQGFLCVFLIA